MLKKISDFSDIFIVELPDSVIRYNQGEGKEPYTEEENMATIKTTRKPTMLKAIAEASNRDELTALAVEYWNELALGYCIEYEELVRQEDGSYNCEEETFSVTDVSDVYEEALYWLSCYYERGNIRHDEEHHDRHAFLKFVEVFRPYVGDLSDSLKWIPRKEENAFLFN